LAVIGISLADSIAGVLQQFEDFPPFVTPSNPPFSVPDGDLVTEFAFNLVCVVCLPNIPKEIVSSVFPLLVDASFRHQFCHHVRPTPDSAET